MRSGYHDLKRPEILALIPKDANQILDLGCGSGALGKTVKDRQPCHVTGIELDKDAAHEATKHLDIVFKDNLNRYDPTLSPKKYDCIILADILEHLVQPWQVLAKFAKVLDGKGTIVASIPNVAHPWIVDRLKKGLFRYEQAGILDITHLRFFTKTTIGQMFYRAGLKIKKITPYPNEKNPIQYHVTAIKPTLEYQKPLTTILILTYNAWEKTKQCLASIKSVTQIPYQVLVIDNGSTDGTVEHLRADNSIFNIENSHNLGFAGGFNIGLPLIKTPYFVISNSDVVMTKNWLKRLTEHIDSNDNLMAIGPRSNYVSGPQRFIGCRYDTPEGLTEFAKTFEVTAEDPKRYYKRIVFFCTLFKTEVLQKVGFLDEIFEKGNFEDDDYCMRINNKGLLTAIDNTVFIHHWGSTTFKANNMKFKELMLKNGTLFMKKWGYKDMQEYYRYLAK